MHCLFTLALPALPAMLDFNTSAEPEPLTRASGNDAINCSDILRGRGPMVDNELLKAAHFSESMKSAMAEMTARPVVPNDLAEFRRQYGLSQRACGTLLGVEQSIIRCWETGQKRIENPVLLALALEGARQVIAERYRPRQNLPATNVVTRK
jgi:DNA-binding transcriptional regulator YiaG